MSDGTKTLYERLGGYNAIAAVANDLLSRLRADPQLGRFWAHRGEDGVMREKQLLIDFLCASAGGPMYYRGRDMVLVHRGMRISDSDWPTPPRLHFAYITVERGIGLHLDATLIAPAKDRWPLHRLSCPRRQISK